MCLAVGTPSGDRLGVPALASGTLRNSSSRTRRQYRKARPKVRKPCSDLTSVKDTTRWSAMLSTARFTSPRSGPTSGRAKANASVRSGSPQFRQSRTASGVLHANQDRSGLCPPGRVVGERHGCCYGPRCDPSCFACTLPAMTRDLHGVSPFLDSTIRSSRLLSASEEVGEAVVHAGHTEVGLDAEGLTDIVDLMPVPI